MFVENFPAKIWQEGQEKYSAVFHKGRIEQQYDNFHKITQPFDVFLLIGR